jgi:hypothetical protein
LLSRGQNMLKFWHHKYEKEHTACQVSTLNDKIGGCFRKWNADEKKSLGNMPSNYTEKIGAGL